MNTLIQVEEERCTLQRSKSWAVRPFSTNTKETTFKDLASNENKEVFRITKELIRERL